MHWIRGKYNLQCIRVHRVILKGWIESGLLSRSNIVVARCLGYAEHKCIMYVNLRSNIKRSNRGWVIFWIEYCLGQHTQIGWAQCIDYRIKYILDIWYRQLSRCMILCYQRDDLQELIIFVLADQKVLCSWYWSSNNVLWGKVRQVCVSCSYIP